MSANNVGDAPLTPVEHALVKALVSAIVKELRGELSQSVPKPAA